VFDPDKYLKPVEEAQPSGPNLEYDPAFQALERAQQGKPEQVLGDKVVAAAEEPDWEEVRSAAEQLLARTRDLRICVPLTRALLCTEGFSGLAAGLALIRGLLEHQWASVHPQLDADEGDDPTSRVNSLLDLASADGLLKTLRETPIVHSKTLGRFSLRDIRVASGRLKPAAGSPTEPPQQSQIDAGFLDTPLPDLQAAAAAVAAASEQLAAVDRLLAEKVGALAPDFKPLSLDLAELRRVLNEKLVARGAAGASVSEASDGSAAGTHGASGEIRSREDVGRMLDRLCEYYRRHEPSSPVPLLLQRAKRLLTKDFLDIVRDLTPSGVAEAESIGGVEKTTQ
jgi:type VI secretion system protein ImpA